MSDITQAGVYPRHEDMTKKIVMGPYFKYDADSVWFSLNSYTPGEVRVIEGTLCYAVIDIEMLDNYDICRQEQVTSRKVIRWEPVTGSQIRLRDST